MQKRVKHYTENLPKHIKIKIFDIFDYEMGEDNTYADLLDFLHNEGYILQLEPFFTFAFVDNTAYVLKILKIDYETATPEWIFDEEKEYKSGAFGGSFWYQIDNALDIIEKDKKKN